MRPCKEHDELGCPMTRINRVNGQGHIPCSMMLIGEAPGKTEDKKGVPFCGKSGNELTHLYLGKCARIDRANVRIDNLVMCRTNDKDRDPTQAEIEACSQLLDTMLKKVKPRYLGTVGRLATQWVLGDIQMDKVHGFGYKIIMYEGESFVMGVNVMPLYHPAFGLHNTTMMRHIMKDWENFGKMVRGDESVMWRAKIC